MSKIIPNTFQTPNIYIDHLQAFLTDPEFRVLIYITRRTLGFLKRQDRISLSQIVNGLITDNGERLDWGAGVSVNSARTALASLENLGIIRKSQPHDPLLSLPAEYEPQFDEQKIDWEALSERAEQKTKDNNTRMAKRRARKANPPPVTRQEEGGVSSDNRGGVSSDNTTPPIVRQQVQKPVESQIESQIESQRGSAANAGTSPTALPNGFFDDENDDDGMAQPRLIADAETRPVNAVPSKDTAEPGSTKVDRKREKLTTRNKPRKYFPEWVDSETMRAWQARLCEILFGHDNFGALDGAAKANISRVAGTLLKLEPPYSLAELDRWYTGVWPNEWPGSTGERPKYADIQNKAPAIRNAAHRPGPSVARPHDLAEIHGWGDVTREQFARYLKDYRERHNPGAGPDDPNFHRWATSRLEKMERDGEIQPRPHMADRLRQERIAKFEHDKANDPDMRAFLAAVGLNTEENTQ